MLEGDQANLLFQSMYQQIRQNSLVPKAHQLSIFQILLAYHAPLTIPACSVGHQQLTKPK